MTREGAFQVAKERLQGLAGDPQRASELADQINPADPLRRTPAQQTGDPNLLGLERQAAAENPLLRERLAERASATRAAAADEISVAGDVQDARAFFNRRLREFKSGMSARVDRALQMAGESVEGVGPRASETTNSIDMTARIRSALDEQLVQEADLWNRVPKETLVGTSKVKEQAEAILKDLSRAGADDFPSIARRLLADEGGFSDQETVREMHGLYSKLREIARAARAGNNQERNKARIADELAEAILSDLGAVSGDTPAGQAINNARAFSRALSETFDQGAVGRILKRTIDGDETMTPEASLARTVGRGGAQAVADAAKIEAAAPDAREPVTDYLRGRFADAVISADGTYSPKRAAEWLRSNRELLSRYPDMRAEFSRALSNRSAAESLASRADARIKLAEAESAISGFSRGPTEKAVLSILAADDPAATARAIAASARKDRSGQALAGVKAAFSQHLIGKAGTDEGLSGDRLVALLRDPKILSAMRQVYDSAELARLQRIASDLAKIDAPGAEVGETINSLPNGIVDYVIRVAAAKVGGQMGGGTMGGSLQTANIAVSRARNMLRNLTNDRARQLLMDAIEDPALFKALLANPLRLNTDQSIRSKLAPYLAAGAAVAASDE